MNIVLIGAHPDDIEIGAGGTIARFVDNGHNVLMIVVTIPNDKDVRKKESFESARILGCQIKLLEIDPNYLSQTRMLTGIFDKIFDDFNPDQIFTHWLHDSHQDHIYITKSIISSTRKNKCSVYMFDQTIPGGIVGKSFNAQMFIDITEYMDKKIQSTLCHISQVKKYNSKSWIEGIEGRCKYHGYRIGVKYAEAFEIIKEIRDI